MKFSEELKLVYQKKVYCKFIILILSTMVAVCLLLFILSNPHDHFLKFTPGEAEAYAQIKTTNIVKSTKFNYLLEILTTKSNLPKKFWQQLLQNNTRIGLYSINGQIFGLIDNNKKNKNLLQGSKIAYLENQGVLSFPKNNTQLKNDWLKQKRLTMFEDWQLYFKNGQSLKKFTNYFIQKDLSGGLTISGRIENTSKIKLTVKGNRIGFDNNFAKKNLLNLNGLPENLVSFENNLPKESFSETEFLPENIYFHLLKNIPKHQSYQTTADFIIFAQDLTFEQLADIIKETFAFTFPSIKSKTLPDGTTARALWAEPNDWELQKTKENNNLYNLWKQETPFPLTLSRENSNWKIVYGKNTSEQTTSLPVFVNSCLQKTKQNFYKKIDSDIFQHLAIINKGEDNLAVCIE
ncbi:MAG: hypothetical protein WCT18_04860 [Patescibacteria group bacterium]